MKKAEYFKLAGKKAKIEEQIRSLNGTVNDNISKIKQASADKLAALRAKDAGAAQTAQFNIDALGVDNSDLKAKITELQGVKIDKAATDAAWNADLIQNADYKTELALFQTVAALYDAICVRAHREYSEWQAFADALSTMLQGSSFPAKYVAPMPAGGIQVNGWNYAEKEQFHHKGGSVFDPVGIDKLIEMLQSVKSNGVDSIL